MGTKPLSVRNKPNKSTGHEAFLKGLEACNATLVMEVQNSAIPIVQGQIVHSDKFSITLRTKQDNELRDVVFFKHSITKFYSLTPKKDS